MSEDNKELEDRIKIRKEREEDLRKEAEDREKDRSKEENKARDLLNKVAESQRDLTDFVDYEDWVDTLVDVWGSAVNYKINSPSENVTQALLGTLVVGSWDNGNNTGKVKTLR